MQNKTLLSVSIDKEYNVLNNEYSNTIYLRLYSSLFDSGIVKDLKPMQFTVLLAIASFMDDEGNCYPTQRQVSEIIGVSLPTVNRAVNKLLEYKVNGVPLIKRELVRTGKYKNSYYTINSSTPISISGNTERYSKDMLKEVKRNVFNKDKEIDKDIKYKNLKQETKKVKQVTEESSENNNTKTEITTVKNVIDYFYQKYKEIYDETYTSNFGRDAGQINQKLIGKFSSQQLKDMIDVTIEEYDRRWANARFKRPTIVAMCTWIGNEALAIARERQKEAEQVKEVQESFEDVNATALSKFGVNLNEDRG